MRNNILANNLKKVFSVALTATLVASGFFVIGEVSASELPQILEVSRWTENENPVFEGINRAYYPTVLKIGDVYHMWYTDKDDEGYKTGYTVSNDGVNWSEGTIVNGLADKPAHALVEYIDGGYKMWYWDNGVSIYGINAIRYAESTDGINWTNDQAITQEGNTVIGLSTSDWNGGSYGPGDLIYNSSGSEALDDSDIWNNKFVMYYMGTNGNNEYIGLAYSADGKEWKGYNGGTAPVLSPSTDEWDFTSVGYPTVIKENETWMMWFGGGPQTNHGIGYTTSADGITWTKSTINPIMHKDDGISWRNDRTYTPMVIKDGDVYKMWFSGVSGDNYAIGYATNTNPNAFSSIQEAIDAANGGNTINVAAGIYAVNSSINVNKSVTITTDASATVVSVTQDTPVFNITANDVTIEKFNITTNLAPFSKAGAVTGNETSGALVLINAENVTISNNNIYADETFLGGMATWTVRGITLQTGSATISGNTVYGVRNGIIVRTGNIATITDNVIFDTKGGIMNYTSNQDDADTRIMADNSWDSTVEGAISHNEWDIVWNTAYYAPDYQQSIVILSNSNNDAYILDRRTVDAEDPTNIVKNAAACLALTGNRSHIFVDSNSNVITAHPAKGNFNEPFATIALGLDAVVSGGTINVAAGTYNESINITKSLTLNGAKAGEDARTRDTMSGESILDGAGFTTAQYSLIMIANGVSDVVIDGFEFKNILLTSTGGGVGNAISSYCNSSGTVGANNIIVKNNYMHDLGYNGILVVSENTAGTSMVVQSGWTIQYNKIENYRYAGIELTNVVNSYVKDNKIVVPTSLFDDPGDAGVGIEIAARSRTKPVTAGTGIEISGNTIAGTFPAGSRAAINLLSRAYTTTSDATLSGVTVSGNAISGAINARAAILAVAEVRSDGPATISNLTITNNILDGNLNAIEIKDYVKSGSGTATHSSVTITGNEITNSTGIGLYLPASTSAAEITVSSNKIFANVLFGIKNEGTGTLNAKNNWWGHPSGPERETPGNSGIWVGKGDRISSYVDVIPWYANENALTGGGTMTNPDSDIILGSGGAAELPSGITNLILSNNSNLDLSAGLSGNEITLNSGTANKPIVLSNSDLSGVSASIPDGTKITGPAGWNGIIIPPKSGTPSGNAPAGFSVGSTVINVGSTQGTLIFDNPVTLLLPNVTGPVGYRPLGLDWIQITNVCDKPYLTPGNPPADKECAISNGTDTKILTYHFTDFGSLVATPAAAPTPAPSSGGYYPSRSTPTPTPAREVLGIATFNFAADLKLGVEGNDVTELQKRLTAEGVYSGPITGYFGQLTLQAVKNYQAKVGVSATGFVGPLTRGQLNASQVAGASTTNTEALRTQIASIQAQLIALIQQLIQMLQADLQAQQ